MQPAPAEGEIDGRKAKLRNGWAKASDDRPQEIFWRKEIGSKGRRIHSTYVRLRIIVSHVRPRKQTFSYQRRITTTMSRPLELEFVLVSSDYATMNAVSGGVKKYGAKFTLVPTAETALECLNRRKIDGVFIDLAVPGGLELIAAIRKGASNCKAVICPCIASARESTATLNAGGNFLLRKPLSVDSVALHITIAKELLLHEQRRYFRHTVNLAAARATAALLQW